MAEENTNRLLLQAALEYAARDLPVFPLKPRSKEPLTPNGFHDATTDRSQVRAWWTEHPNANIGIACGDHLVVVDIDGPEGTEALKTAGFTGRDAPVVKTAKGFHYWFRGDGVGRHQRALPAVDVCGQGGYVLAPPSVHPSGDTYRWKRQLAGELPPLPQVVLDAIERSKRGSFADRDPEAVGEPIGQGERNSHLTSLAGTMRRRGMTVEEIEAALLVTNKRCDPPLPDQEVRQIARSIGHYPVTPPDDAPPAKNGRSYPAPREWIDTDLMAHQFPPIKEVIPGLVVEGATLLIGKPKKGKSALALNFLVAVTNSGRALGDIEVDQGEALYVSLEDGGRRLQKRLTQLGHQASGRLTVWESCLPIAEGGLDVISGWLDAHPAARLVVLDTLQRMRSGETGTSWVYASDYEVMGKIHDLAQRHKVAVLVLHHSRKAGSEDFMDLGSGSNGLMGAADTILVMKRLGGETMASLEVGGRDVPEDEHALQGDAKTLRWERLPGPALDHMLQGTRAAIRAYVRDHPGSPPKWIAEGTGLDYELVKKTCKRMADDGQLVGRGGRYELDDDALSDAEAPGTPPETPETPVPPVPAVPRVPDSASESGEPDDWYHLAELRSMDLDELLGVAQANGIAVSDQDLADKPRLVELIYRYGFDDETA